MMIPNKDTTLASASVLQDESFENDKILYYWEQSSE